MNIHNYLDEWVDKFKILKWAKSDRENLFRIILEIYNADGTYSEEEKSDFKRRSRGLGIDEEDIKHIDLQKAIAALKPDALKMELVHFWLASALFADEDFDKVEQSFIDGIITKYGLNEQRLREIIKTIQDKKIDHAIRHWYSEIEDLF
ncbi:MAG TPA: hypothetical protein PKN48_07770 [Bacteroidales bacterium]|nr:hypothetical protein [Bacteroidales bacterium]